MLPLQSFARGFAGPRAMSIPDSDIPECPSLLQLFKIKSVLLPTIQLLLIRLQTCKSGRAPDS